MDRKVIISTLLSPATTSAVTIKFQMSLNHASANMVFNTDDSEQTAIDLASAIIDANDSERYEEAWEYVGQALDTKKKGIV